MSAVPCEQIFPQSRYIGTFLVQVEIELSIRIVLDSGQGGRTLRALHLVPESIAGAFFVHSHEF